LSRAQGCLLGQVAGDSLGSLVEFQSPAAIEQLYPGGPRHLEDGGVFNILAGQPTDDSEMALLLARTFVGRGEYDPRAALAAYQYWLESGPFDCGNTIAGALRGNPSPESEANGALMRISPLGVYGVGRKLEVVAEWARADAALTHPNPVCLEANALFVCAIAKAIAEGTDPEALYSQIVAWAREWHVPERLMAEIDAAASSPPDDFMVHQGWVGIAFRNALYQLLHAPNFEEAVVDTVRRGGDTDTNAAICGALLGAVYGRAAIPARWTTKILSCRASAQVPNTQHSRPDGIWPSDLLQLAELLIY